MSPSGVLAFGVGVVIVTEKGGGVGGLTGPLPDRRPPVKLRRHRRIPGKILETEARMKTRRRLMNKNTIVWAIVGFVVALVIAWVLGFEINPF